jgi:hypothetical protein
MNGLRIYVNLVSPDMLAGDTVFYSRRADGPYYRWCYEENLGRWRGSRMHASDLAPRELSLATWKGVPSELKTKLREHYVE